jgi:hypothetical protein
MSDVDISIIIVSFNTRDLVRACLDSITAVDQKCLYEIVVVDNNSDDGTADMLESEFTAVKCIRNSVNAGFGRANNQGAGCASGEYLLFLNSDTVIQGDSLLRMLRFARSRTDVAAVGPKILNQDLSVFHSCRSAATLLNQLSSLVPLVNRYFPDRFQVNINEEAFYQSTQEVDFMWGACLMIRRDVFLQHGGFDERFFMYFEEADLLLRLRKAGFSNVYYPEASVVHLGGGSSRKVFDRCYRQLYLSRVIFFRKHHGLFKTALLWMGTLVLAFMRLIIYGIASAFSAERRAMCLEECRRSFLIIRGYCSGKSGLEREDKAIRSSSV